MPADRRLQQRPREGTELEPDLAARRPAGAVEDAEVAPLIEEMAAGRQEVGRDAGEQLLDHHQAALEEEVEMAGVRHAGPVLAPLRQAIALDDGDGIEMLGEHARREHAADAPPHHDRVAAGGEVAVGEGPRRASVGHGRPAFQIWQPLEAASI